MRTIDQLVPEAEDLLTLQPEELGGVILQLLSLNPQSSLLHRGGFLGAENIGKYPRDKWSAIQRALTEGWIWLESEGLIAPEPGQTANWVFITRRGEKYASPENFQSYRSSGILKKELLHPLIAEKSWSAFLRGDYDSAVFTAFKAIEIKVRECSKQPDEIIGVTLIRKAFDLNGGHLTPKHLPKGEQEALMHLLAGAIGWFKNPQSHRDVKISQIEDAARSLVLASQLLYLIDVANLFS